MEWLTQAITDGLKGNALEPDALTKAVAAIEAAIKQPMAVNMIPKVDFNAKNDELKTTKAALDKATADLTAATKGAPDADKLKADLEATKKALDEYKAQTDNRENDRKKAAAIERNLRKAKAAEDAIDLLTSQFDLSKLTLDAKGEIVDWSQHFEPVKTARKSLFAEVDLGGNPPANPPGGAAKTTKAQLIAAYNAAEQKKDVVSMMALTRQINEIKE